MSSNNNFNETFLTKKGEDVTFGEDSTDTMVVNSNSEFNSQTTFNSQINMGGPIIPTINNQFDIGSAEYKVRDLYLSSSSLHIGETILSEDTTDGLKIKIGGGTENEFKLAKLDAGGRLPNDKMPEGLLDGSGKINKTKIEATLSLNDLANVDTSDVAEGKALVYSGTQWQPGDVAASGGTSVTAHTDTQTGDEDYLSALTVGGTKYKVGTSIQNVSYSDTSKLLLSFPFANATTQAEAETNYGSLSNFTLTNSPELSLVSGGIQSNSSENDLLSITNLSLSESFTVYLKWLKPGDVLREFALAGAGGTTPFTAYSSPVLASYGLRENMYNNILNDTNSELVHLAKINNSHYWYYAVEFSEPQTVSRYRIWARYNGGNNSQMPKRWELRGATDRATYNESNASTYTVLDSQSTDQGAWPTYSTGGVNVQASDFLGYAKQYEVSTPGEYKYYVIHFTHNWGHASYITLSEVAFYYLNTEESTWYPTIFQLLNSSNTVVSHLMIHDGGEGGGDPNNDILIYHRNGGTGKDIHPFGEATFSNDLYFHTFVVYDRDSNKLSIFMNSNGATPVSPDTVSESGLSSWSTTVSNWETITALRIGKRFDDQNQAIDIIYSNLMVFNEALILNDAQDWADYVDRGYVNQGNPAPLKYLADVSETTPLNGQALVYDSENSQWQPGNVAASVQAHTDTQTGNEDYLSALTVEGTKYKIGTSIQNVSYSDSSKLHLSFPFQRASTSAEALVNQVNGVNATTSGTTFTPGTGFIHNSSDRTTIDIDTSITLPLTIFIRFYRTANSNNYQFLFHAIENDSDTYPTNAIQFYQDNSNSNLQYQALSQNSPTDAFAINDINGYVVGRWTNACMVLDNSNNMIIYTDSSQSGIMVNKGQGSPVKSNLQISKLRLGNYSNVSNPGSGDAFNGYISDFYVFKTALSAFDVQAWTNYINNDYVNPGNPAPLKYLADVSETTPLNGDSLVYSSLSNQWVPQKPTSLYSLPAVDNAKIWVVAGESFSRIGNYPIEHVGTGRTFSRDADGHLYLNHSSGANYLRITDSNAMMDFSTASYTIAVVVDLSLNDGFSGTANNAYSQTFIVKYDRDLTGVGTQQLLFMNNNQPSTSGSLGIDYYTPDHKPFMDTTHTSSFYEGKALIVVTFQNTSSSSQTVTLYKNGSQTFNASSDDIDFSTNGTNIYWHFAGDPSASHGGFQTSKFYAAAVWDRVLTIDEINQLTIDKLVTTTPVSANPTAPATADLTKVSIGGTDYNVGRLPYIEVYRIPSDPEPIYYSADHNNIDTDLWDGYTSSHTNMTLGSGGAITVPPGTYIALFHLNFRRNFSNTQPTAYSGNFDYYQTIAGVMINSTKVITVADENAKESGLIVGRVRYGNVFVQKIITVGSDDIVKFFHNIYYLPVTITTATNASLIRIA